ncbi:MAG: hypothetical protein DCF24_06275, partial [Cyanobium sp.]
PPSSPAPPAGSSPSAGRTGAGLGAGNGAGGSAGRGGRPLNPRPDRRLAADHPELYTEFQQLLLEDEEDPAGP